MLAFVVKTFLDLSGVFLCLALCCLVSLLGPFDFVRFFHLFGVLSFFFLFGTKNGKVPLLLTLE